MEMHQGIDRSVYLRLRLRDRVIDGADFFFRGVRQEEFVDDLFDILQGSMTGLCLTAAFFFTQVFDMQMRAGD